MKIAAIAFIVLGLLALGWGGLHWTQTEKVVDLGPIEVNKETHKSFPLSPLFGVAALVAGGAILLTRKTA